MSANHSIHGKNKTPVPDELQVHSFPYETLMGDWMIVGSSLKLWKNRSDVLCKYTPHSVPTAADQLKLKDDVQATAATTQSVSFSDEIWWEQLDKNGTHQKGKGAPRDKQSIVRGRNRIDPSGVNGGSYLWRGYNFLKLFTSHWQIVAYSHNFINKSKADSTEPLWIVTYFTATLFTDAGIDLYVRGTLGDEEYDRILESLQSHQGDTEADKELQKLAKEMFKIPVGNV
ncbi:hypothetical protein CBS101457_003266 [Exobasidium rhododendri]|nr:hypothetical protein CBS101457_003266 [Exobasidium rhododendri]